MAGRNVGLTPHVGGIFLVAPARVYDMYSFPQLKLGQGYDWNICEWFRINGSKVGYLENIFVNHIEGTDVQAERYPEYHKRKLKELDEKDKPKEHKQSKVPQRSVEKRATT